jgi:hypothetical protein
MLARQLVNEWSRRWGVFYAIPTPALDPLFIAYNTGAGGRTLRTTCIVRKYFTQETASNPVFGSFSVKNYSKRIFFFNFCPKAHQYWIHSHFLFQM